MAILPILLYPDPRLKEVSAEIALFDEELTRLIDDLLETLYDSPGCVGIAAPQVAARKRLIIVDAARNPKITSSHGRMILINPEIVKSEGEVLAREGCLSLPHLTANVKRAQHITVKALNENGHLLEFDASDFEARVVLHERDHLDGLLFWTALLRSKLMCSGANATCHQKKKHRSANLFADQIDSLFECDRVYFTIGFVQKIGINFHTRGHICMVGTQSTFPNLDCPCVE